MEEEPDALSRTPTVETINFNPYSLSTREDDDFRREMKAQGKSFVGSTLPDSRDKVNVTGDGAVVVDKMCEALNSENGYINPVTVEKTIDESLTSNNLDCFTNKKLFDHVNPVHKRGYMRAIFSRIFRFQGGVPSIMEENKILSIQQDKTYKKFVNLENWLNNNTIKDFDLLTGIYEGLKEARYPSRDRYLPSISENANNIEFFLRLNKLIVAAGKSLRFLNRSQANRIIEGEYKLDYSTKTGGTTYGKKRRKTHKKTHKKRNKKTHKKQNKKTQRKRGKRRRKTNKK